MKKQLFRNSLYIIIVLVIMALCTPTLIKNTKFGLDLQGGFEVLYEVKSIDGKPVTKDMVTSTYKTISKRIDVLGVSEPSIIIEGDNKVRVQLAGITDPTEARNILSKAANLTFRDTNDNLLMNSNVLKAGGAKRGQSQTGKPAVSLSVKDKDKFYEITKTISERTDNRIVIWLDFDETDSFKNEENKCGSLTSSKCLSVAGVSQGFASDVVIEGNFTIEEVDSLVELINSGSLPTKLEEVSSKTVGSTLGTDSLNKTALAGIVGISVIFAIIIIIYHFAGFIATIGLLFYTFITFLSFWLIGGVLTLPGIAALVIGIAMAIDSSIITFARIKDELKEGKKLSVANELGNKNSFSSIFDANVTTLLVAIILFVFGESSVKGFATMLIISIITTMIIMVWLTRYLLTLFIKTKAFDKKLNFFIGYKEKKKEPFINRIKIVKYKKLAYIYLILITLIGGFSLYKNGLKLGIDFQGGSSITIMSKQNLTESQIKKDIKELNYNLYEIETLKDNTIILKISDTLSKDEVLQAEEYFSEKYEATTDIGVVSNIVKKELIKNAIISLLLASIGIIIYIAVRFTFNYAISSIITLIHDAFIMIAIFSIFQLEVSSIFIAALLSIIGYSLNDTIVTFDRVRENIKKKDKLTEPSELEHIIDKSIVQTLGRSIITSFTTLCTVAALIVLGSHEIINFNIALFIGLIAGVLSTIYIAAAILYDLEKRNIGKPIKKKWYEEEELEENKVSKK